MATNSAYEGQTTIWRTACVTRAVKPKPSANGLRQPIKPSDAQVQHRSAVLSPTFSMLPDLKFPLAHLQQNFRIGAPLFGIFVDDLTVQCKRTVGRKLCAANICDFLEAAPVHAHGKRCGTFKRASTQEDRGVLQPRSAHFHFSQICWRACFFLIRLHIPSDDKVRHWSVARNAHEGRPTSLPEIELLTCQTRHVRVTLSDDF